MPLGYKWVAKNSGFVVNYVQISLICSKQQAATIRLSLETLDAAGASDRFTKVKLPYHAPSVVMSIGCQLKKTSGARHAFGSNSSDSSNSISRSRVGLRGPRALGHVFGKRFLVD